MLASSCEQLDERKRSFLEWKRRERQVQIPALDRLEEIPVVSPFRQLDHGTRTLAPKELHDRGQHLGADTLKGADTECAFAVEQPLHICLSGRKRRQHAVGVAKEKRAVFGEGNAPRAAWPVDQAHADDALEGGNLMTNRRLRVPKSRGGAAERFLLSNRVEGGEMPKFDAEPLIRGVGH